MRRARAARTPGRATAPTGFRLCGIVDEPPPAASRTSPTSVCASRTTSSPIFAQRAGRGRERRAELRDRARSCARAASGSASSSSRANEPQHAAARRRRAPRASRPRRRAAPRAARSGSARAAPCASSDRDEPAGRLRARTSSAPPAAGACGPPSASSGASRASAAQRGGAPSSSPATSASARRGDQHRRGVDDVLARRAVVDVRARPRRRPRARSARTSGSAGFPTARPSSSSAAESKARLGTASAIAAAASAGTTPAARLGSRQRALDVEHRLRATRRPTPPRAALRHEEGVERRHTREEHRLASPWRRMSKRSRRPPRGDERRPRRLVEPREHRVGRVGLDLVREVHPRQRRA